MREQHEVATQADDYQTYSMAELGNLISFRLSSYNFALVVMEDVPLRRDYSLHKENKASGAVFHGNERACHVHIIGARVSFNT